MQRLRTSHLSLLTSPRRGFTIVELMIVLVLMAIAFALVLPTMGDAKELRLTEAARMLAADFEFAQNESITHPADPRLIKFDDAADQYWIAAASDPATPITDPVRHEPFLIDFGTGRASGTTGVTLQSISVGGDDELRFDAYGSPDQTANAVVTLASGPETLTVTVHPGTGEVTIP